MIDAITFDDMPRPFAGVFKAPAKDDSADGEFVYWFYRDPANGPTHIDADFR